MNEFVYGALCGVGGFVILGFIIALAEWLTETGYHLFGSVVERANQRREQKRRTKAFDEVVNFPVILEVFLAVSAMIIFFILAFALFVGLLEIFDW